MIMSLYTGRQPWEQFNQVKLTEDNDATVVINDEKTSDLIKLLQNLPEIMETVCAGSLSGSPTLHCTPTYDTYITGLGMDSNNASLYTGESYGGTFVATGDSGELAQFHVRGMCPHGAVLLPFGKQDLPDDWYDVSKIGNLALILTAASGATGTCSIVSQQNRKY